MTIEQIPAGPRPDDPAPDPAPWTNNAGVVKFIEFPARLPSMSRRAFHLYWTRHHSVHVMNVMSFAQFMRKYSTGHVGDAAIPGLPGRYRQDTAFEGAAEVWIDNLDQVGAWLGHPAYAELIQPDETRFIHADGVEVIVAKEERLHRGERDLNENGLIKVYLLYSRRVATGHDAFHAAASDCGRALLGDGATAAALRQLVLSHRIREPWPEGLPLAGIDTVMELWFAGPEELGRFFAAPAVDDTLRAFEERWVDAGRLRAVIARMRVIHDEFSFQPSTTQPLAFAWEG
jgi:hypothetical protein